MQKDSLSISTKQFSARPSLCREAVAIPALCSAPFERVLHNPAASSSYSVMSLCERCRKQHLTHFSSACCRGETSHGNPAEPGPEKEIQNCTMGMTRALELLDMGLFLCVCVCVKVVTGCISHEELVSCSNNSNSNHNDHHNKIKLIFWGFQHHLSIPPTFLTP